MAGRSEEVEDKSAQRCGHNLGQADGAVEQPEVSAHVPTLQGVGEDGERQCQHCRPSTTDEGEAHKEEVLVVDEEGGHKTDAAQDEAEGVDKAAVFELRNDHGPQHRTDRLNGKENAHPVAGVVVLLASSVKHNRRPFQEGGSVESIGSNRSIGVGPHEHKRCPAEELYQAYRPKRRGSFA